MRIVSLLPALTELVGMLGHEADLVGVSHECDVPASVASLPKLTRGRIDPSLPSGQIDVLVSQQQEGLYRLDTATLATLRPDIILTQAQCEVCAVSERTVRAFASDALPQTRIYSAHPTTLGDVRSMFGEVASILGATAVRKLAEWDEQFQATCGALETSRKAEPTPALLLEWLDPPFSCGHWNPELITLANGRDLLAQPGARSRRYAWSELEAIRPQAIIVAPCGRTLEQTRTEVLALDGCEQWRVLRDAASCIVLADGNSYFARPGPQLLQSLRILGRALDPMADLATPHSGWEFLKR